MVYNGLSNRTPGLMCVHVQGMWDRGGRQSEQATMLAVCQHRAGLRAMLIVL